MTADNLSLAGKVAIITGSGRENGIGAAIALTLARNGALVTINYVSESSASRAAIVAKKVEELGSKAAIVQTNIETPEGARKLVQGTLKAFGTDHIDILVNNAAFAHYGSTLDVTTEDVERSFKTNVWGPLYMVQAVAPHMPRGGRIINISSVAAKLGLGIMPVYSASKAALDSLTYVWAQEFGGAKGITVNSIAPGPVATDIANNDPDENPAVTQLLSMTRAEKRFGTVQDQADAVLLLVSEKSRWITGQYISVSGGITGQ